MHEKLLVALITALTTLPMTTQNKINKNVNKNTHNTSVWVLAQQPVVSTFLFVCFSITCIFFLTFYK